MKMYQRSPGLIVLAIVGAVFNYQVAAESAQVGISLKFSVEPAGKVDFANTKGVQIECSAEGKPSPRVEWTTADGLALSSPIAALRDIQSAGRILNFYPFTADQYRIDVHNAIYRCSASNSAGIIKSRDVNVNGVVLQSHDIQVYDTFAIEGNTAVFKCHVPSVLSDYVHVTAWIKNDNLLIQPTLDQASGEKYAIMPSGELHIRDVTKGDSASKYRCKTVHRLTGETKDSSNTGQLLVTASHGTVPPRIVDSYSSVTVTNRQTAILGCVGQGNPSPNVNWYKKSPSGHLQRLSVGNRVVQSTSLLMIKDTQVSDAGIYTCEAVNEMGKEQLDITLIVTEPLMATIRNPVQRVKLNDRVTFKCEVTGNPSATSIYWMHNGAKLDNEFKNEFVVENVQMDNRGMYQCVVSNDLETVQASAELQLSEISPYFVETFKETNLQPGSGISLKCVASGIPLPSIVWKLDQTTVSNKPRLTVESKLDSNGRVVSTLKMDRISVEDGGLYSCIAKSDAGSSRHFSRINVQGNLGKRPLQEYLGIAGQVVVLHCPVYGYPIANIIWEKDDKLLPYNMRQNIAKDGSLEIESANKISDSGMYKCTADDGAKAKVDAKVKLSIMVPPKIVPFEFQEELLREGMRARLQCVVSEGELPLNVSWLKDGKPFSDNLGVIVRALDEFSSILTISSISPRHNGRFTCVASNAAATVTHTARLSVNVAPKIVPFTFGVSHYEGSPARVVCGLQEGDAPIHFSWLHENVPLTSTDSLTVHEVDGLSSILSITKLSPAHKGTYTCIAKNGAGADRHQAALHVNAPKIVPFQFQGDHVFEGALARLTCVVYQGDLPLTITWHKDLSPIPNQFGVSTHLVDTYTSVLTIDHVERKHQGNYSCLAQNMAASASHTAQLTVNVPPKIVPFEFQEEQLVEGMLARVSCIVSRGDLPLKLRWEKDGQQLSTRDNVTVRSFDEHSSILSIANVSPRDNGLYTCFANNDAGTATHSAQLIAIVPPRWIVEPTTANAITGQDVMFHCQAHGFPQPQITWMQSKDIGRNAVRKQLTNSDNAHIFSNGSLLIRNVGSTDHGYYFCRASNGIGNELSAVVQLKLHAPPHFKDTTSMVDAAVGKEVQLQCLVNGDPPMKMAWYKDNKIVQEVQTRIKIQTTSTASDASSILTINKVTKDDQGMYVCSAENKYGTNKTSIKFIVRGLPLAPNDLRATSVESTAFELTWKMAQDPDDPIKKYIIQYKEEHDSWENSVSMETVNGEPTNSIISNLRSATNYMFRMYAQNVLGKSPSSQILRVTTLEAAPSGPPTNIQVESVNTETFKVMWKAPNEKHWNGKLQGFYVGYKEVDTNDPYLFKTLLTPDPSADDLYVQIGGLKQFTKYAVVVLAYNSQGKGPESEPVIVMTSEGAPSLPPTDVRCTILTSQSIHVTWTAPPSDSINGILRGYKVVYKPVSDWFDDLAENFNVTLPTALTVINMEKFTNYSIQVLAMTKAGDGPRSSPVFCKTLDDVPCAPTDIKAIATSEDSVIVSWKPPECPNGILRSYSIYWKITEESKAALSHMVTSRDNSFEVTSLKKGKRYEFCVSASTMAGEGKASRTISQTPTGPTVAAKVVSFDEKIVTPWKSDISLTCQAVGLPEPQKRWLLNGQPLDRNNRAKISPEGTLSMNGLEEEEGGDYSCHVKNDFGEDRITYTIIVLAPPSAPVIELTSMTANTIDIQWKVPASKMSRIKGYTLHSRRETGEWKEITIGSEIRSYQLNNMDCGTRYEIYLTAFNKIGLGQPSEVITVSTNGSVPAAPSKPDLIEESSSSVSLYLNTWKSNGCPILYYRVEYAVKGSNDWTFVSNNIKPEQRRLVIRGLRSATWFSLRMTAHNSAGSSVAEYTFATLNDNGGTIAPDLLSDSTEDPVDGILPFLNYYVIVPIGCTVVILLAILGAAWFYIKLKSREDHGGSGGQHNRPITPRMATLRRGNSSESFAYMQRGTMKGRGGAHLHEDDLAPYATFQLANQGPFDTINRKSMVPPPLPPPRSEAFSGDNRTTQFFVQSAAPGNMMLHPHMAPGMETTFIFPNLQMDNGLPTGNNFSPGYPHEALHGKAN